MRTNIVIDDALLMRAKKLTGLKTKKALVEEGLKLLVRLKQQTAIKAWRGKLRWTGNLGAMRTDKKRD